MVAVPFLLPGNWSSGTGFCVPVLVVLFSPNVEHSAIGAFVGRSVRGLLRHRYQYLLFFLFRQLCSVILLIVVVVVVMLAFFMLSLCFQKAEALALEATKKFGATSPEARLAWDTYEEVAAADNSIATRVTLDEDCDVSVTFLLCVLC